MCPVQLQAVFRFSSRFSCTIDNIKSKTATEQSILKMN